MLMGPVGDLQLPAEKAKEDEELKQKEREAAAEKRVSQLRQIANRQAS